MATHSSTVAWRILSTEEPDGLQSIGSQRVRHPDHGSRWEGTPPLSKGCRGEFKKKVWDKKEVSSKQVLIPKSVLSGRNHMPLNKNKQNGTFLEVQWLRNHLPMQGTWVQSLVGELRCHMLWSH